ncbi:PIN domain-containing protein [uncultured Spirosoma sp.]|uniref:PIN domain-containing protein n=1 Tax=uncultured Spirosoma sp. TaxID=278208 RepID=UPI00258A6C4B|nr:PIN domain-containing protein [uncultured Spirosoma sp.]
MRKIIIDHNILFAAIHTKTSLTRRRLLDSPFSFYTPNYLVTELFKHRQRIVEKSKAAEEDVFNYLNQVIQKIHFFNEELISLENFFEAYHLCKDVDENDTAYIALTLELRGELWTRDEVLKASLRQRGFDRFFDEH